MNYKIAFYILVIIYSALFFKILFTYKNNNKPEKFKEIFCESVYNEREINEYFKKAISLSGKLLINLQSNVGDCDIFISYLTIATNDVYNKSFISWGDDLIWIEAESARPIYIGIYCYNQNFNCTFLLNVCNFTKDFYFKQFNKSDTKFKNSCNITSTLNSLFFNIVDIFVREIIKFLI